MKKLFLLLMFMNFTAMAVAQTAKLTGVIYDSLTRTPLESATVSLYNMDSSMVTYQLADKNGMVSFDKLPLKKKIRVSVSFIGYNTLNAFVQLNGRDTLHVFLSLNTKDTSSATVTTVVPVRMNGDTLEINPGAFKMKEHQVVEELLNQVPGITVWSDGSLTLGGRKVQNLLVDGKPFVGSTDPRIATQNLPKSAIDKIQVYQEYDRENIGKPEKSPADSVLTMNIKLKESAKKGYFGKGGAGYGTDDRKEADFILQVYDKKNSWAIGGGYNNINKDIGSVNQILQNNTFRTTSPDLYRVGRFGAGGITDAHTIGTTLTRNFNESVNSRQNNRLMVTYDESGTGTVVTSQRVQDRIGLGDEQIVKDMNQQVSSSNRHNFNFNYFKTNSYNDNLNSNGSASIQTGQSNSVQLTEITSPAGVLQSTNSSNTHQTNQSHNESLSLSYAKNDYENPVVNVNMNGNMQHSYSVTGRNIVSTFTSQVLSGADTSYNRYYNNTNESVSAQLNINYGGFKRMILGRFNLYHIDLSFIQNLSYAKASTNAVVSDFDSASKGYLLNKNLTNQNNKKTTEYLPSLSISKSFSKNSNSFSGNMNVQMRLMGDFKNENNMSSIIQRNLNRSFQFFRYDASINYFLFRHQKYMISSQLSYNKNYDYPSVDALYTIVDDINAYSITIGNPNLKMRSIHNLNFSSNYNTQKPQSVYSINGGLSAGYSLSQNPVSDSIVNTPAGKRITYYINADQSSNFSLNYNLNIAKKIKKNNVQIMMNGNYNTGSQPGYIDGVYNQSKNMRLSNQFSFRFSWATTLVLGVMERFDYNKVHQTVNGSTDFENSSSTTDLNFNLNCSESFSFGSTLDYVNTSTLAQPTVLWNAFATQRLMHQQAEIKFSAMDILKQYVNIFTSASAYGTSTSITNGLQQYFLLTFAYYPRKFGKRATEAGRNNMN